MSPSTPQPQPLTAADILNATATHHPLQHHVDALIKGSPHFPLTPEQGQALAVLLPDAPARSKELGADFSIKAEVVEQLRTVQHLRQKLLKQDLTPQDNASVNDIKALITLSSSLLSTLMKFNKDIDRDHRLAQVEKVMIEVLKTLPETEKQAAVALLEERLGGLSV